MATNAESAWWWEDAKTSQFHEGNLGVHVIIMDDAGKPVFSSFPDDLRDSTKSKAEEQTTKFCGMVQALRSVLLYQMESSDIQSVVADGLRVAFVSKGALTLIALSADVDDHAVSSEAVLRLHLDHLYARAVFHMTLPGIQACVEQDSAVDWSSILGASASAPRGFLTTSVPMCSPIPQTIRHQTSVWLQKHAASDDVFYAILCHQKKVVTFVQPDYPPHQLHATDLNLLLDACTGTASSHGDCNQRWFSVCLPRLDASATLQCCVTHQQEITLILLTPSPEREAAVRTLAHSILPPDTISDIGIDESVSSEDYELVAHPDASSSELDDGILRHLKNTLETKKDILEGNNNHQVLRHFLFRKRFEVQPAKKRRRRGKRDEALGCLYESVQSNDCSASDLKAYHDLCFRLRFGMNEVEAGIPGTGSDSPLMALESFPTDEAICYQKRNKETHLAMNGKDFEL